MLKRILALALFSICLPLLGGCSTYYARTGWRSEGYMPRFYPATYLDGNLISLPFDPEWSKPMSMRVGYFALGIVDLPFSLITDTLFLPEDIWFYPYPRPYYDYTPSDGNDE